MKIERPGKSGPSSEEISESPGIIVDGKFISKDELTLDVLLEAKIEPEHFKSLLVRYTRQLEMDALTGLSSRHLLKPRFNKLIKEMNRKKEDRESPPLNSIMFIVVDLDKFKFINDNYGHEAGDNALKAVTARIRENLHDSDMVFRIGGDELLIILPIHHTEPVNHEEIFQKRKEKISTDLSVDTPKGKIAINISVGHYVLEKGDKITLEQAIAEADAAMYQAKAS
ncbi:hypothetical protein A3C67_01955 [Candidatus Nomurabacteria bacterium RIFCSPHIGHO2_02_FULL_42_19]|uniref:GGDEF domain-containing protein n=1 Tax=Candidatus Nomurabacteria bacterium RIFCSPHIGHO2_02_FULL_42_19 TaxID=1801756 RepID=A0A1F6W2L2_9BACT|nr:MAG: hypothetical protein A3C67_01955 [Candidatus Nomurabacteria bacterium RIFCSPHIGHO2_02_FULL_42_19]